MNAGVHTSYSTCSDCAYHVEVEQRDGKGWRIIATGCAYEHDRVGEAVISETLEDAPVCGQFWPMSGRASEVEALRAEIRWLREELTREGAHADG